VKGTARTLAHTSIVIISVIVLVASVGNLALAAPAPFGAFAQRFSIAPANADAPHVSQMAWGPDGRLYCAQAESEIFSFAYNRRTGLLFDKRGTGVSGMGVAFASHVVPGTSTAADYMYVSHRVNGYEAVLSRYTDSNHNFAWGEGASGEVNVDLVRGVPLGDHSMNHIQIAGNQTLYVGIGVRTINGRNGSNTAGTFHDTPEGPVDGGIFAGQDGFTYGETSYNGSISRIANLTLVPNVTSAAQLRDGPNGTSGNLLAGRDAFLPGAPHATIPYTSTAPDKLVVQSAGTRNPFGLALDRNGQLWFANNYGRADTNGDGTSNPHPLDQLDSDLSNDVHDQLFKAQSGGDYRYDNFNFRGNPAFPHSPVVSQTFDNLDSTRPGYGQLQDPAGPNGLGPSSSSDGLDFVPMNLSGIFPGGGTKDYAVVARWNDVVAEAPPGTDVLHFADVAFVDPVTGIVHRALDGFINPIDVLSDRAGGFFVADFGNATIYHVSPRVLHAPLDEIHPFPTAVPEPVLGTMAIVIVMIGRRPQHDRRGP
jgi:hypothetical protein